LGFLCFHPALKHQHIPQWPTPIAFSGKVIFPLSAHIALLKETALLQAALGEEFLSPGPQFDANPLLNGRGKTLFGALN
jgi:hypothetical protein